MIIQTITWVGFSQALFGAILMFTKKKQTMSDKLLSAWLMLLAIQFLFFGLDTNIFGYALLSSSFLIINPSFYFYTRTLVEKDFQLKPIYLLHLLPFIISQIWAYITQIPFSFINFFVHDGGLFFRLLFVVVNFLSWFVYIPLAIRLLVKYIFMLQNEQSSISNEQNLHWLYFVVYSYIIYCLVAIVLGVFFLFNQVNTQPIHIYNYSALLLLVYVLSFYGLRQKRIEALAHKQDKISDYYKNSTLSDADRVDIKQKILLYFDNNKAYLNSELNMKMLSEAINYPKYQITEVLNKDIGRNFFQFVNAYRVEAVKEMLLEPQLKYSIEAIGYECGFSSKSAFYTVFKAQTGETPISFRKKNI